MIRACRFLLNACQLEQIETKQTVTGAARDSFAAVKRETGARSSNHYVAKLERLCLCCPRNGKGE